MEDIEIPEELKEVWRIISNMKFDVTDLEFALSWVEGHPDHIDDVEDFCHGAKSVEEIRSKIESLKDRIYELEIEANRLRLEFTEKIAMERLGVRR